MARLSDIFVGIEIEPVVKLTCLDMMCKYNCHPNKGTCLLKRVDIGADGNCRQRDHNKWVVNGE
jgi:hypothetical protein